MEYLCILNAFEQTYYNRIKEIERVAAAAASHHRHNGLRNTNSNSTNSPSGGSSSNSSSSSSSSSNGSPPSHLNVTNPYHHHQHHNPHHQAPHSHSNGHNNATNVANSLLWQPWRDFTSSAAVAAAAAAHHHFYQQQQHQQIQHQHQQQQQTLQKESRLTAKELPTTKWRRDRRMRAASEYQHSLSSQNTPSVVASPPASPPMMVVQPTTLRPLCESTNRTPLPIIESPIDMSVTSTTMKPRASPPPPYREPLPGSTFATTLARPSVITQAPPKRGDSRDSILISNRENDNQSTESISMCETVIDEHFRRSLGPDYVALFGKKSPVPSTPSPTPTPTPPPPAQQMVVPLASVTPTLLHQTVEHHRSTPTPPPPQAIAVAVMPQALTTKQPTNTMSPVSPPEQSPPHHVAIARVESPPAPVAMVHQNDTTSTSTTTVSVSSPSSTPSVDDHFAKALGDTWKKLQADKEQRN